MIGDKKVLAVIPARGGSKGVPGKNIRDLAGKPLIAWTVEAAQASTLIDRVIVTTDSPRILEVATAFGADAPFLRPAELSQDDTPGAAPFLHALAEVPGYDIAVLLQPTSPLRSAEDIDGCVRLCFENDAGPVLSVTEVTKHPAWMFSLPQGRFEPILPELAKVDRRQDLPKVYSLNGAIYTVPVSRFLQEGALMVPDSAAYVMPSDRSVDIDTEFDFAIAEFLMGLRRNEFER